MNWEPSTECIEVHLDQEVAVVTLRRPAKLNALTKEMRLDLASALRHFGDGNQARGIVLTGEGRAFSAGEDLLAIGDEAEDLRDAVETFHDLTRAALETRVPTIAAVNGLAVGGACELTLCFDSRIGTKRSEFFLPENQIGLVISNAASFLLPRLIGHGAAIGFVLGSRRLDATSALGIGLLDKVVCGDIVDAAVAQVIAWTKPDSSTVAHLRLLRPDMGAVEQAMDKETVLAQEVWMDGASSAGIGRFRGRSH